MWYPIAVEVGDGETAYGVVVPDLPGCFSAGDTFDEAILNAREAIEGHIENLAEHGEEIPKASDVSVHMGNPAYRDWVWAVVDVDVTPYMGKSQKINVTLPELLIKRIDDQVARDPAYKSRSGFLADAAMKELRRERSAQ
ncbi:hypothetical protein CAI21_22085 [Alkalilimnicola ehrlichii]|uniref:HicB-like antitoxin of toxin-antitoxin system domain-containing protein n=1 Tax=Alkalilimnicola ehrlichii TaxID=351052 RepID=A0A3E0WQL7_9GAMM|nr:type II toxin-antitoxin system HicB family antitoxin [Alkalilimnicola ehrlichii]RFA24317.1 hypothetical protein CAI21_22085 [Alkalilimnicola ehrlichii]RFA35118.1 hypothetical protein CAL65_13505 [Alkalilimnicola ehrlichii]